MPSSKTQFKKGKSGNPRGMTPMPAAIKAIRRLNRDEMIKIMDKYSNYTVKELKKAEKDLNIKAIEMIIIKNIIWSLEKHNVGSRDFIIERLAGKVREEMKIDGNFGHKSIIDQLKD